MMRLIVSKNKWTNVNQTNLIRLMVMMTVKSQMIVCLSNERVVRQHFKIRFSSKSKWRLKQKKRLSNERSHPSSQNNNQTQCFQQEKLHPNFSVLGCSLTFAPKKTRTYFTNWPLIPMRKSSSILQKSSRIKLSFSNGSGSSKRIKFWIGWSWKRKKKECIIIIKSEDFEFFIRFNLVSSEISIFYWS